ncbi:hypothetical protein ACQP2E_17220 [Actinoplanes sp. CA-015351]|uniref:hypothetical protein n=1 Tax=Actinoplanes sp. CA-015351 TaxID=3239897 RepID=UPI003D9915C8
MCRSLLHSGILDRISGMVVGIPRDIPVPANVDFGHAGPNLPMPVGVRAGLDADRRTLSLLEPGCEPVRATSMGADHAFTTRPLATAERPLSLSLRRVPMPEVKSGEPIEDTDEVREVVPSGNRWPRVAGKHFPHRLDVAGQLTDGGLRRFVLEAERIPRTDRPVTVSTKINNGSLPPFAFVERRGQSSPQVCQGHEGLATHRHSVAPTP